MTPPRHYYFALLVWALPVATIAQTASPSAGLTYPSKPVRYIVPFPPGAGNDIIARIVGQKLAENWGQQVVVDNRPGAGGNIAAEMTARAAPDGYTVFQFNVANAIAASLYQKLNYDPIRDFAAVTQLASSPFLLVVHPTVRAKTTHELIALAKSEPGKLNYASSGNGGSGHLVAELFKAMSNINLVHIPYSGGGPAMNDLLGGQVQILFAVPAAALAHVKAGRLRALGVSSLKRIKLAPELPTISESGVVGFEGSAWYGVVVPALTSRAIVARLNADILRVLQQPEILERLLSQGVEVVGSSPEDFAQFIKSEVAKWSRIVKISGAKVE
ncbi:MAG TPA: tripartite tricarboxylate transporter substrate binding protein [Burkholderiales bacterium]|nr:tripartite tricarboxylate transporter substrate binding protein [Burkholderiales bacterium]